MTAGEVGVAAARSVTAFAVQAPAGVWADRWSRRAILSIAQLLRLGGFAIRRLYPHFWGFIAGFVLWGLKSGDRRTGPAVAVYPSPRPDPLLPVIAGRQSLRPMNTGRRVAVLSTAKADPACLASRDYARL